MQPKLVVNLVGNVPVDRRANLEGIPLAGISNPDVEIQDLSVMCLKHGKIRIIHSPMLINLRDGTDIWWLKAI